MSRLGFPEIVIPFVLLFGWLIPLAPAAWAIVTLHRIRSGQEAIRTRIETIQRLLERSAPG